MAPRLRTRPDQLVVAGLVALALLALGEQAPAAFPVHVSIEASAANLQVNVDGETHSLSSALGGDWQAVALEQPGPIQREYQIDGSDTTSTNDRRPDLIRGLLGSPLYTLDAFLRDEGSYSRWENLRITDLDTGLAVAPGAELPSEFRVEADLRRPESAARLWLIAGPDSREGLELDRDRRNARWIIQRGQATDTLPRWFFPEQPTPFAAELLQLLGRSAAAAFLFGALAVLAGRLLARGLAASSESSNGGSVEPRQWLGRSATDAFLPGVLRLLPGRLLARRTLRANSSESSNGGSAEPAVYAAVAVLWLAGAALVSVHEYAQLPHILDAISYTFQAGLFASGQLSLPAPGDLGAFKGPFTVLWHGRLFSQYPPGAPAVYALGSRIGLEWLVGPVACAVLIGSTAWTARALFGSACGFAALALGVISPFVLFQAGSYLSHPVTGGLLAAALAAFVAAECRRSERWYLVCGVLLGAAFTAREVASFLFAVPLGVRLMTTRRWTGLSYVVAFGLPFVFAYLFYNALQTGSPLLLPRSIFDPSDHFGFGDGIGFHTRHTLAAGLANTDELLTLLQFDLFGWPPLFAFGLIGVPFLFGRARTWDFLALGGFGAFVVAYVGYFYHGNALGPRYYFEAMPWLLLLAARGAATLAHLARTWLVPTVLLAALSVNTFGFYLPAELARRANMSGLPGAPPLVLDFVAASPFGPSLPDVPDGSLVVTTDWWLFNSALAALNCPHLPDCRVVFALAPTPGDEARLHAEFPSRKVLRIDNEGRQLKLKY